MADNSGKYRYFSEDSPNIYAQQAPPTATPRWPLFILTLSLIIAAVGLAAVILHMNKLQTLNTLSASLAEREATVASRESAADAAEATLAEQKAELLTAETALKLSQEELAAALVDVEEKERILSLAQAELQNQDTLAASLAQRETDVAARESAVDAAESAIAEKQVQLATVQAKLDNQMQAFFQQTSQLGSMVGLKAEIISEITSTLSTRRITASVDPNSGDIVIDSGRLTFETNKAELTTQSKQFLDAFVPVYLEVLMRPEYSDYLGSIIIEGHTNMTGSYERNMELSHERALEVMFYIRNMYQNDPATLARLDQLVIATGKGWSDPVYYTYNSNYYVDQDASRRVEFKFSLRDAEMIEEINRLLNGN